MTNHEQPGVLRCTLTALSRALMRGILGKASDEYMKQFTASNEYGARATAAQLDCSKAGVQVTNGFPSGSEYEPVHGWTRRQCDDYLARNPAYRVAYEAKLTTLANGNNSRT